MTQVILKVRHNAAYYHILMPGNFGVFLFTSRSLTSQKDSKVQKKSVSKLAKVLI